MAVNSSVLAQAAGHGVALLVGYYASRQGFHVNPTQSAEIAAVASMVVGPVLGHLVNVKSGGSQADKVVSDVEQLFSVVAESGSNPRSALSKPQTPVSPPPSS